MCIRLYMSEHPVGTATCRGTLSDLSFMKDGGIEHMFVDVCGGSVPIIQGNLDWVLHI